MALLNVLGTLTGGAAGLLGGGPVGAYMGGSSAGGILTASAGAFSTLQHPFKVMGATAVSPFVTGAEFSDYAADANYMFDSAYNRVQAESAMATINQAPNALFKGTVKAGLMFGTLPTLAKRVAGLPTAGKLTPIGLRTALWGTQGKMSSLWGFAAGTIMSGSPIGGAFMAAPFGMYARAGGAAGLISKLTGQKPDKVSQQVYNFLGGARSPSSKFEVTKRRVSQFRERTVSQETFDTATYLKKTNNTFRMQNRAEAASGARKTMRQLRNRGRLGGEFADNMLYNVKLPKPLTEYEFSKMATESFDADALRSKKTRTREYGARDKAVTEVDLSNRLVSRTARTRIDRRMDEFISRDEGVITGSQIDEILNGEDLVAKKNRASTLRRRARSSQKGSPGLHKKIFASEMNDVISVSGVEVDVSAPRRLAASSYIAKRIDNKLMRQLMGTGFERETGLGVFRLMRNLLSEDRMAEMRSQVDIANSAIEKAAKKAAKKQVRVAAERTTKMVDDPIRRTIKGGKVRFSAKIGEKVKTIGRLTTDTGAIPKLSVASMFGRAGMVSGVNALRALYIMGGVKKIGSYAINNAINTLKTVSSMASNIGRMEFGTGRTLDNQVASNERSRAIQAMQNIGISARSYMGREAAMMADL